MSVKIGTPTNLLPLLITTTILLILICRLNQLCLWSLPLIDFLDRETVCLFMHKLPWPWPGVRDGWLSQLILSSRTSSLKLQTALLKLLLLLFQSLHTFFRSIFILPKYKIKMKAQKNLASKYWRYNLIKSQDNSNFDSKIESWMIRINFITQLKFYPFHLLLWLILRPTAHKQSLLFLLLWLRWLCPRFLILFWSGLSILLPHSFLIFFS